MCPIRFLIVPREVLRRSHQEQTQLFHHYIYTSTNQPSQYYLEDILEHGRRVPVCALHADVHNTRGSNFASCPQQAPINFCPGNHWAIVAAENLAKKLLLSRTPNRDRLVINSENTVVNMYSHSGQGCPTQSTSSISPRQETKTLSLSFETALL